MKPRSLLVFSFFAIFINKEAYPKMAKEEKEFENRVNLRQKVYDTLKDLLVSTTEEQFSKLGFKPNEDYYSEYATGEKFGVGAKEGKFNIQLISKTKSLIEKNILLGAKRINSFITVSMEENIAKIHYNATEMSVGRYSEDGPLIIKTTLIIDAESGDFKEEVKKFLTNIAKQEVYYITNTKLGVEDKVETKTFAENTDMSLSFKKLFFGSFEDTENMMDQFINERKKSSEEVDQHHPDVKDTNTVDTDNGTLLFDDSKIEEEEGEDSVSEVTSTATAGAFAYSTPFAFKKAMKQKKEESKRASIKKERSSDGFWTVVDIEPLKKTHPLGMPGVEVGSQEELRRSMNGNKPSLKESFDINKRKFVVKEENESLGVNKRYIITPKLSAEEEKEKWARLCGFQVNESIQKAEEVIEECGCPVSDEEKITRSEYEEIVNKEFSSRNEEEDEFEPFASIDPDGEDVIAVEKPDSFVSYKFAKTDFMNENKLFIIDLVTNQYVINPNHKTQK